MAITTTCPGCKGIFRLPEELAGQSVRCQKCERMFVVPLPTVGQGMPMPSTMAADAPVEVMDESEPLLEAPASVPELVEPIVEAAPSVEPIIIEPKPDEVAAPEVKAAAVPERPRSQLWTAAAVALFVFTFFATGAFAAIWVSTHLTPPPRVVLVPPLKQAFRDPVLLRDRKDFFDGPKDLFKEIPMRPKKLVDNPKRLVTYLVEQNQKGVYQANHAFAISDPLEPSVPGRGPYKDYILSMTKGRNYHIEMMSPKFTPMLSVLDERANQVAHNKGNKFFAAIDFTPDRDGTYRIRAIAATPIERDEYGITIMELP